MAPSPDQRDDDVHEEYDFSTLRGVVRGKYATQYGERVRIIHLDPDVAAAFPDDAAVNSALRQFLAEHPRENAG